MYIGDMVQNVHTKKSFREKKIVKTNEEDWIIVEGTHEPIIDKDTFERVQNLLDANYRQPTPEYQRIFKGLMYCHECGHKIGVGNPKEIIVLLKTVCLYLLQFLQKNSAYNKCTPHTMNYNNLEEQLMDIISNVCKNILTQQGMKIQLKKEENSINIYRYIGKENW